MGLKGEDLPGHSRRESGLEVLRATVADLQESMKYTSAVRFLAHCFVGLGGSQETVFIRSVELTLKSNKQNPYFLAGGFPVRPVKNFCYLWPLPWWMFSQTCRSFLWIFASVGLRLAG